jgi:hypothetical protein
MFANEKSGFAVEQNVADGRVRMRGVDAMAVDNAAAASCVVGTLAPQATTKSGVAPNAKRRVCRRVMGISLGWWSL